MSFIPSCKDVTEKASEYVDKEMSFWQRLGFRLHLFICVHCRRYVQQLRLTIGAVGKLNQDVNATPDDKQIQDMVQHLKQHAGCKSDHKH